MARLTDRRVAVGLAAGASIVVAIAVAARPSPQPRPAAAPSWQCKDPGGPWHRCWSDALWLRRVIITAAARPVGSTGSALILSHSGGRGHHIWASTTSRAGCGPGENVADGPVEVSEDGVRTSWSAQFARVWVSPPPPPRVVRDLVGATCVVPRFP